MPTAVPADHHATSCADEGLGRTATPIDELEGMTLGALKRRLRGLGQGGTHDVDDDADPKAAVIRLILAAEHETSTNLRKELESMTLKALKARGRELGMGVEDLDSIDEADAPKSFLVELIEARVGAAAMPGPSADEPAQCSASPDEISASVATATPCDGAAAAAVLSVLEPVQSSQSSPVQSRQPSPVQCNVSSTPPSQERKAAATLPPVSTSVKVLSSSGKWRSCRIVGHKLPTGFVKVHYEGFATRFDEWIDLNTADGRSRLKTTEHMHKHVSSTGNEMTSNEHLVLGTRHSEMVSDGGDAQDGDKCRNPPAEAMPQLTVAEAAVWPSQIPVAVAVAVMPAPPATAMPLPPPGCLVWGLSASQVRYNHPPATHDRPSLRLMPHATQALGVRLYPDITEMARMRNRRPRRTLLGPDPLPGNERL